MNTQSKSNVVELTSIAIPSSKVRDHRNTALNIMEQIKHNNENYGGLMTVLNGASLNIDRFPEESQLSHLDRIVRHLAVIEGEQMKSEVLKDATAQVDTIRKPHAPANEHELPKNRQRTKLGRLFQNIANSIG